MKALLEQAPHWIEDAPVEERLIQINMKGQKPTWLSNMLNEQLDSFSGESPGG